MILVMNIELMIRYCKYRNRIYIIIIYIYIYYKQSNLSYNMIDWEHIAVNFGGFRISAS